MDLRDKLGCGPGMMCLSGRTLTHNVPNWHKTFVINVINSGIISGVFRTISSTDYITVHWGDGTSNTYSGTSDSAYSHTYPTTGNYEIQIVNHMTMTKLTMTQSGTNVSFDLSDLPSSITTFSFSGANTITGDLSDLPSSIAYFFCGGANTITGDLSDLPSSTAYFYCIGNNTVSAYTSGKIWATSMSRLTLVPVSPGGLSSTEIDNLLIDLALVSSWSNEKLVELTGSNSARTSASDTAVATLNSKGVTVTTIT